MSSFDKFIRAEELRIEGVLDYVISNGISVETGGDHAFIGNVCLMRSVKKDAAPDEFSIVITVHNDNLSRLIADLNKKNDVI